MPALWYWVDLRRSVSSAKNLLSKKLTKLHRWQSWVVINGICVYSAFKIPDAGYPKMSDNLTFLVRNKDTESAYLFMVLWKMDQYSDSYYSGDLKSGKIWNQDFFKIWFQMEASYSYGPKQFKNQTIPKTTIFYLYFKWFWQNGGHLYKLLLPDSSQNSTFILKNSTYNSTSIHQLYYSASTRLRSQTFSIRLDDESRVGTLLRQNLLARVVFRCQFKTGPFNNQRQVPGLVRDSV